MMPETKGKDTFKSWTRYGDDHRLGPFSQDLARWLSDCKTERETIRALETDISTRGVSMDQTTKLLPGDLVYFNWKGRALLAAKIGRAPLTTGIRLIGSHADSPRIDVKAQPLYEDSNMALWDCHYYGGIKKYQWPNRPLALHGEVHLRDGRVLSVVEGEDPGDPVFMIPDLAPHLDRDIDKRKASETILGENLDAVVASRPGIGEERTVLAMVKKHLHDRWNVDEEDLVSADLSFVPLGRARDMGFDRSILCAYGLDDRVCVFTSYMAFRDLPTPSFTAVFLAVDREEIGSEGVGGAQSEFLELFLQEVLDKTGESGTSLQLRRCLAASQALSADVTEAVNPMYKEAFDPHQMPLIGNGITLMKGTGMRGKSGGSEARGEFVAQVVHAFDEAQIPWQVGSFGKVDKGGGGTIAMFLARRGLDVLDVGPCLLSLHAPWEAVSKADALCSRDAYEAFWLKS